LEVFEINEEIRTLEINGEVRSLAIKDPGRAEYWKVNIVEPKQQFSLGRTVIERINEWLEKWAAVFPREETFAWKQYGVPSLIVRPDFTFVDSKVKLYEIEDIPAGIGIATRIVPDFNNKLKNLGWPKVIVIMALNRTGGGDDSLWTEVREGRYEEIILKIGDCLVAPRLESLPSSLKERSIWPVEHRKNKEYLPLLGLAEEWDKKTPLEQVVNYFANKRKAKGVVFKSDGGRAERVRILIFRKTMREVENWLGNVGGIGVWTLQSIKEEVKKWKRVYIQEFYPPIKALVNGRPMYAILRIYFGFSEKREWTPLGGFINARPSLLIHGATNSYFVPIAVT
jgi:hypothetical protein